MRGYLLAISGIIILGAVLDVLMPDGDFRKYIKPVFGMIMVLTIMRPLLAQNWSPQALYITADRAGGQTQDYSQKIYQNNVAYTFSKGLEQKITTTLQTAGVSIQKCQVKADFLKDQLVIKKVTISLNENGKDTYIKTVLKRDLALEDSVITILHGTKE